MTRSRREIQRYLRRRTAEMAEVGDLLSEQQLSLCIADASRAAALFSLTQPPGDQAWRQTADRELMMRLAAGAVPDAVRRSEAARFLVDRVVFLGLDDIEARATEGIWLSSPSQIDEWRVPRAIAAARVEQAVGYYQSMASAQKRGGIRNGTERNNRLPIPTVTLNEDELPLMTDPAVSGLTLVALTQLAESSEAGRLRRANSDFRTATSGKASNAAQRRISRARAALRPQAVRLGLLEQQTTEQEDKE